MELKTVIAALKRLDERDVLTLCGQFHNVTENLVKYFRKMGYEIRSEDGYGGAGLGEEYWGVFSTTKDGQTQYWRFSGYYASYNGAEVEPSSLEEVKPKEVKVIEWVKK